MTPFAYLPADEGPIGRLVKRFVAKWGHQSRDRPSEHDILLHLAAAHGLDGQCGASEGCSGSDKEGGVILSSMHKKAGLFLLLGVSVAAVAGSSVGTIQMHQPSPAPVAPVSVAPIAVAAQAAPV